MQILQLIWNWSQSTLLSINRSPLAPFSRIKSEKRGDGKNQCFLKKISEWSSSNESAQWGKIFKMCSNHTNLAFHQFIQETNTIFYNFSTFSSLSLAKPILLTIISWSCRTWSQIVLSTNSDHQVTIEPPGSRP